MSDSISDFIGQRAEILAKEFLTRRIDVEVHPFEGGDLDFVVTIQPNKKKVAGFLPFGVIVWGTEKPLRSEGLASTYATERWHGHWGKSKYQQQYFLPVLALVFAVREDVGYYAWLAEPSVDKGAPQLSMNEGLHCTRVERDSMDSIVETVNGWYHQLAAVIVPSK